MGLIDKYVNDIKTSFVSHNLYFFIVAVIIFQMIDFYIVKHFPLKVYQVATFMSLYLFITMPFSAYDLLMSGILASFISYYVYKVFVYLKSQKRIYLLNIVTFISVLLGMIVGNCVSMPALAYTLMTYKSIPASAFSYLYSYIGGSVIIILISFIILHVLYKVNDAFNIGQYNQHFNQVKSNLSNWKVI